MTEEQLAKMRNTVARAESIIYRINCLRVDYSRTKDSNSPLRVYNGDRPLEPLSSDEQKALRAVVLEILDAKIKESEKELSLLEPMQTGSQVPKSTKL